MNQRPTKNRGFVTLTLDPKDFGGRVVGSSYWPRDDKPFKGTLSHARLNEMVAKGELRRTNLWSEPTPEQFAEAKKAMTKDFKRLCDRMNIKAKRAGYGKFTYFRITELHRSGWPHFHVIFEHNAYTTADIQQQLGGWRLGRVDARDSSLEDAVGEVAPYLSSKERETSKAYQFATHALPRTPASMPPPKASWLL